MLPVATASRRSEGTPTRPAQERRASPRLEPGERRVWLGSWADAENFGVVGAVLLDISRGGVAVATDEALDPGKPVWIRLEAPGAPDCVAARVVGVSRSARGPHVVRLAFQAPCPGRFFRQAMQGAVGGAVGAPLGPCR
jgi:hypothetical protein